MLLLFLQSFEDFMWLAGEGNLRCCSEFADDLGKTMKENDSEGFYTKRMEEMLKYEDADESMQMAYMFGKTVFRDKSKN